MLSFAGLLTGPLCYDVKCKTTCPSSVVSGMKIAGVWGAWFQIRGNIRVKEWTLGMRLVHNFTVWRDVCSGVK